MAFSCLSGTHSDDDDGDRDDDGDDDDDQDDHDDDAAAFESFWDSEVEE